MRLLLFSLLILIGSSTFVTAAERIYRLGQLALTTDSLEATRSDTLPELAKLGFSEGRNMVMEQRTGDRAEMPGLARALVLSKPDAIIAIGTDAIRAAQEATRTVPIIAFGPDLVRAGLAASHARPGGNVTGVTLFAVELAGKRLDILREAAPAAHRVAALMLRSMPGRDSVDEEMRTVALSTGLELLLFEADGPDDYGVAIEAMRSASAQALIIHSNPLFYRDAAMLAGLALEAGLPTICEWADMAKSGCLIGYGPSRTELRRRVAHQVARIFNGATPNDIPIEQPTKFEMAINMKTAMALGLMVPPSILARADEVIE